MLERLVWPLRKLAWKIDEKVVWPVADGASGSPRGGWWKAHWLDLAVASALGIAAYLSRRHGMPTDGLWLDDSIAGAALLASPAELLVVSQEHSGFTALLAGISPLTGDADDLAYPALVAGTLGPPLLFLGLRRIGYARAVSLLLGAALVAAQTHIVYSGRVRTYTIDLLIVLALVMILPRLTRIQWRWPAVLAWVGAMAIVASFSVFAMIAGAAAGVIVLLRAGPDLPARVVAVGAQAAITGILFFAQRATYDGEEHEASNSASWDTFVEFDPNPLEFGDEILLHLRRLGETLTGNLEWLALVCAVLALGSLAVVSFRRGPQGTRARYLLLITLIAFGASLAGKFPFGAALGDTPLSDGHRWSLWLIPVLAIGVAVVLQRVRELLEDHPPLLFGFDALAAVAAVLILVSAGPALQYPFSGKGTAAEYVESERGPRDAVLLPYRADWSFAAETEFDATVDPTPESSIGFRPEFTDPSIANIGQAVDRTAVAEAVRGSERVFVYYPEHAYTEDEEESRAALASSLRKLGFQSPQTTTFGDATVELWRQPDRQREVARADALPSGWERSEAPSSDAAARILDCLGVRNEDAPISSFAYTGPGPGVARSDVIEWQDPETAQEAIRAFRGPNASECLTTPIEPSGTAGPVEVRRIEPPPGLGGAVAFRLTNETTSSTLASIVFFARGGVGVLIGATAPDGQAYPAGALSTVIADAARQVTAREGG
jgi:hypothetical protein